MFNAVSKSSKLNSIYIYIYIYMYIYIYISLKLFLIFNAVSLTNNYMVLTYYTTCKVFFEICTEKKFAKNPLESGAFLAFLG